MRYGFLIDHNRCIGCHACTVACKEEHDVPLGVYRTWVKYIEKGNFPETRRHFGVLRCNHCDDAPCVEICPTVALFRRGDGIVDFDGGRCIGCKSCMQACPYDAIYIDPNTQTAAKCNFCAHRVEAGLEPACVIVCPEQAIIAGDLDEPTSSINQILAHEKVSVRKPEKRTRPKLFYAGIEPDLLRPTTMAPQSAHLWGDKTPGEDLYGLREESAAAANLAREVYDVPHPPPWGKKIVAYLWTKSIAAGALPVATLLLSFAHAPANPILQIVSPAVALTFTALTFLLLIFDLKRPDRFYYLVTKGNPKSWLVIGGYILAGYGLCAFLWLMSGILHGAAPLWLACPAALLGIGAAAYTAFLFAQAKGRDLWQSPFFLWHLVVQAAVAGSAVLLVGSLISGGDELLEPLGRVFAVALILDSALMLGEIFLPHATEEARRAADILKHGALAPRFWAFAVGAGALLPLLLILVFPDLAETRWLSSFLALAGLWIFEDLWMKAGQAVPLS